MPVGCQSTKELMEKMLREKRTLQMKMIMLLFRNMNIIKKLKEWLPCSKIVRKKRSRRMMMLY